MDQVKRKRLRPLRGTAYDLRYVDLVERDGEKCGFCGRPGKRPLLHIHHRDSNPENNRMLNLKLACNNCDQTERWTLYRSVLREKEEKKVDQTHISVTADATPFTIGSREINKSEAYQPAFRNWVIDTLIRQGEEQITELIDSGAEKFEADVQTTARWLQKMVSTVGPCFKIKLPLGNKLLWFVKLKPDFYKQAARQTTISVYTPQQ